MRRVLLAVALLLTIPGVAVAGGGVDTSGCAGYSEGSDVSMRDSCFAGTAHFVPSDTAITVSNDGALPHTYTAVDGSFDTGQVEPGESAQLTFDDPGVYRVFCTLHGTAAGEGMAGVVVVGEAVPASMSAPLDFPPFEEIVAAETEPIWRAMDRQGRVMGEIRSVQADIEDALVGLETPPPAVVEPPEMGEERVVILVLVGLAVGVALASLLTVLRLRITGTPGEKTGRMQNPSESSAR